VAAYLRRHQRVYRFGSEDRFSQFAEISFDFSVHELFVAGAPARPVRGAGEPAVGAAPVHSRITASRLVIGAVVVSLLQRLKLLRKRLLSFAPR